MSEGEKGRETGRKEEREREGNRVNKGGLERRRKPRQRGDESSSLSATIWAAPEHNQEIQATRRTLPSFC